MPPFSQQSSQADPSMPLDVPAALTDNDNQALLDINQYTGSPRLGLHSALIQPAAPTLIGPSSPVP